MPITNEMVHASYEVGKEVYAGRLTQENGAEQLHLQYGMDKGSAKMYIRAYCCMRNGTLYTQTINEYAVRYYLESILGANGKEALRRALASLSEHLEYQRDNGYNSLENQTRVYDEFVLLTLNLPFFRQANKVC